MSYRNTSRSERAGEDEEAPAEARGATTNARRGRATASGRAPRRKSAANRFFEPPGGGRAPSRAREDASDARGAETLEARGIADDVIEGVRVGPREASSAREAKAAGETRANQRSGGETGDKTISSSRCRFPGSFCSVFTRGWSRPSHTAWRLSPGRGIPPRAAQLRTHERARCVLSRGRAPLRSAAVAPSPRSLPPTVPPRARSLDPSGRTRLGTRPRGLSPIARAFAS